MVAFARIKFPVLLAERMVLAGDSSLLVPELLFDDLIQWHFLNSAGRFDKAQQRNEIPDPRLQTLDIKKLTTSRSFLGYCKTSEVLLSTKEYAHVQISESGVPRTGPTFTLRIEGPFGASVNVHGYATFTAGTTWRFNGGEAGLIKGDELEPDERFRRFARTPALLYDAQMSRAFLVSELSITLHMVSAYLRKNSLLKERAIPYATASADGGAATYEAIKDAQTLIVPFEIGRPSSYTDVVAKFLTLFELRKAQAALRRREVEVPLKAGLRGWDYADL